MTPREFIVTPSSWLTDHKLNSLSDDAELLFRRLAACTDKHWRFLYDPQALEHTVRTACFSPQRRFRAWNSTRLARALNELFSAAILVRHFQSDRHWLQVAEAYRYEKGRDPFGILESELKPPIQPDLTGLEPVPYALPTPAAKSASGVQPLKTHVPAYAQSPPSYSQPGAGIGKRTESEQNIETLPLTRPDLAKVLSAAANIGIEPHIAETFFHDHESRPLSPRGLWTDRNGTEIAKWQSALAAFGNRWRSNDTQWARKSDRHATKANPSTPRISREAADTLNAAAASRY